VGPWEDGVEVGVDTRPAASLVPTKFAGI
jgi:hypothetical protein